MSRSAGRPFTSPSTTATWFPRACSAPIRSTTSPCCRSRSRTRANSPRYRSAIRSTCAWAKTSSPSAIRSASTVTRGIISGVNRILPETPLSLSEPLIQTDTPINPSNSGGPLLNMCGEVIGMNTAIVPDAQNIGFAIPINLVKSVVPALIRDGRMIRPWIGFHGTMIGPEVRKVLKLTLTDGLLVEVIEPGSPAEAAGMRGGEIEFTLGTLSLLLGGDIITSINGILTTEAEKIAPVMRGLKVGDKLTMEVFREGETRTIAYTLPERPLLPGDLPEEQAGLQQPSLSPRHEKP